jgi:uncharacterized protein (DUF305 family)
MQKGKSMCVLLGAFAVLALLGTALAASDRPDRAFVQANTQVMDRMMSAMATKPTGDVDADFVDMMEPHHRGAIEMAELELRYGHNEQLHRVAQEIIVEQQQEIIAMRLALKRPLPPSAPTPDQSTSRNAPAAGMPMPKP